MDLFSDSNTCITIDIPDGNLLFYPHFYSTTEADDYFSQLMKNIAWKQEKISMYGKEHNVPRLTAWYGDEGIGYEYSGIKHTSLTWIEPLLMIKRDIEATTNEKFNSVLLNLYRDGSDSVSWHSDDEPALGPDPVIASLSFGDQRTFQLKHKKKKDQYKSIDLPHGSLLLMGKKIQKFWRHQLPKSKRALKPRINLTFRFIY